MRWIAIAAVVLAVIVRFAWRSRVSIAIPVAQDTHRAFTMSAIVFWLLVLTSIVLVGLSFATSRH